MAAERGIWIGKQLFRMMVLLGAVTVAVFALLSVSPIDPLTANVGQTALGSMSPEQVEKLREYWGTDQPALSRFLAWAGDFIQGDMGTSLLYRRPVKEIIWERFLNSVWLMGSAWVLSGVIGFGLGILAGRKQGGVADRLVTGYCMLIASTPAFWIAMILLLIFAVHLQWLPIGLAVPIGVAAEQVTAADRISHMILPAAALSLTGISNIAMHTRQKMAEVMESDYVLFARARGETERSIIWRHGIRNVALPALTLQFASISEIFGGSVLVEQVFSYPGLGQTAVTAGLGSDVPLLMGVTVITAAIVFGGNAVANILYGLVDPRMKNRRKKS